MSTTTCQEVVAGMGGMRTAGDLVARVQLAKAMKTPDAKKYVAGKLHLSVEELTDPVIMDEVRRDLGLGRIIYFPGNPIGMEAKINIARVLDIEIKSVNNFMQKTK
jgi:dimethylamine--corrinoid protein Co-methyltransferase